MIDPLLISQVVLWMLVLALALAFLTSRGQQKKGDNLVMQNFGIPILDKFPEFTSVTFQDKDWLESLKEHRGNILLFTSATCASCQGLYPIISEYSLKNDVGVILFMEGNPELIWEKIKDNNIRVPVVHFTPDLIEITKVPAFPYSYYLSKSGIVYNKGGTQVERELDILLNNGRHMEKIMGKAS